MIIMTNATALAASDARSTHETALSKSIARLSSGKKIINPADDAAGLAMATHMEAQVNRLAAAKSNVANGISFTQTQDGYLQKVGKALDRMSDLALYDREFQMLGGFITDAATKEFNHVPLFDGTDIDIAIDSEGNTFTLTGIDLADTAFTDATASAIDTPANSATALTNVLAAITKLSEDRATAGVSQSRLAYAAETLTVSKENLTAASSRIMDVDVAEESTELAKNNVLMQASTAMLAQANQLPQNVLSLLQ
jgi:flagellin